MRFVDICTLIQNYHFKEVNTAKCVAEFYQGKDSLFEINVLGNGVVITIEGKKPKKTVALRANFDALPIHEETHLPFKSANPGVIHAYGGDGHTAIMLVVADSLIQLKD